MSSAAGPNPPEIPGYRLEHRIGAGGMAEVWQAVQVALDRRVALKIVSHDADAGDEVRSRFEREARVIARLDHPHIVAIHDIGRTADGRMFYTMPLLPNGDLGQRDLRFQAREVLRVLRGMLDALAYAHDHGVVHRDVKPQNILFDKNDRPLLADFGIALSDQEAHRVTSRRQTLGSSSYMSPEQARSGDVDARADLYSLGIVAFELLSGKLPYHGADALAVALAHIEQPVPKLPPVHRAWQPFIERALAKLPADRFGDAGAMRDALEQVAAELEREDKTEPIVAKPRARDSRAGLSAGIALVLALAVLASILLQRTTTERAASAPAPDAVDATLAAANAALAAGRALPPVEDNAAERFLAVLATGTEDARARAGLDAVMASARNAIEGAIASGDFEAATRHYDATAAIANRAGFAPWPQFDAVRAACARAALAPARGALEALDVDAAAALLPLLERVAGLEPDLDLLHRRLGQLPAPGAELRDRNGPALRFVPPRRGRARVARGYALGMREVTRAEYERFVRASGRAAQRCRDTGNPVALIARRDWREPGFEQSGEHPVVCVSAEDARAYTAWLGRQTGARYRLPTRAEWQHAALGLNGDACKLGNVFDRGSVGFSLRGDRHDCDDGARHTAVAGRYAASALGIEDLIGNVAEWLEDCAGNPCRTRLIAASSWRSGARAGRPADYLAHPLDYATPWLGFRVLRELSTDDLPGAVP